MTIVFGTFLNGFTRLNYLRIYSGALKGMDSGSGPLHSTRKNNNLTNKIVIIFIIILEFVRLRMITFCVKRNQFSMSFKK